ncbi:hypothetical protein LEP1GSC035_4658 [Leptospira noguchii str. 2007001578]|uniref:Uncharacterized protein n=1 Tax=Leptospira noguchii str. 2007001578 TaxID=1049974 RepID=A0ABN0J0I5_9LEPT|nr:hypothetical protein LEP1GSC035_4658 [Leptospira noguchii str. 2007001578]
MTRAESPVWLLIAAGFALIFYARVHVKIRTTNEFRFFDREDKTVD